MEGQTQRIPVTDSNIKSSVGGVNSYMIGGTIFDIPIDYTPIEYINRGAYGVVCSAVHNSTGIKVAIKKVSNAFNNLEETKRLLREIKLLRHFNHENVLAIVDIFKPGSRTSFEDIYLVTDLMDTDLQQIISSSQILSVQHIQYFLYQVLCGVKYIHSANVLHRDLKPSNILCNEDCTVKLADFGLARIQQCADEMTEYVATRWYRAPEVILSWKEYTKAIDIWSVGCIFAELFLRQPLFRGQDYIHQITRITDILGNPPPEDMLTLGPQARKFLNDMPRKPKIPWSALLHTDNPLVFDLLDRMLAFNPLKRCTVEEALSHPFFDEIRDTEFEAISQEIFAFDFEKWKLSKDTYQQLLLQEIRFFHPDAFFIDPLLSPSSSPLSMNPYPNPDHPNDNPMDDLSYGNSMFGSPTINPFESGTPDFDQFFGGGSMMED